MTKDDLQNFKAALQWECAQPYDLIKKFLQLPRNEQWKWVDSLPLTKFMVFSKQMLEWMKDTTAAMDGKSRQELN